MSTVLRGATLTFIAICMLTSSAALAQETDKPFTNRLGDGSELGQPPERAPLWPGFTREKKKDKRPIGRTIKPVYGFECMDLFLALRVQNLLMEGKEVEALALRAHKAEKPGCVEYMGPLNYENYDIGTLEDGGVIEAICDPFFEPRDCVFFPMVYKFAPLELDPKVAAPK